MNLSYKQEILARFMVKYPVLNMRTMQMAVEGWASQHPFSKNALSKGAYTVRAMSKWDLYADEPTGFTHCGKQLKMSFRKLSLTIKRTEIRKRGKE